MKPEDVAQLALAIAAIAIAATTMSWIADLTDVAFSARATFEALLDIAREAALALSMLCAIFLGVGAVLDDPKPQS